ncbi:Holliday junction DNA helicase RuvB C-terminal domain-containing protein [Planctomycetota bacterium]
MEKNTTGTDVNQVKITSLSNIHGQPQVIDTLQLHLRAHFSIRATSGSPDSSLGPVILTGPSGTGKTMVAKAIHAELGNLNLFETNGVTVNNKLELFSILINADANTTIFIDEAQGMSAKTQQILLTAISEGNLYVPANIASRYSHVMPLAKFTLILATTHEYQLRDPLRNRMRIYCRFDYYSVDNLMEIVRQRANALKWQYESDQVLKMIAQGAKKTPRLALNRNLQTCWHVTKSHDRDMITINDAYEAFSYLQIDQAGLDSLDRSYLKILLEYGKSSLGVLSSKLSLPALTVQKVVEPYLLKESFITKDRSTRLITQKGKDHIRNASIFSK